jgi:LemA protein
VRGSLTVTLLTVVLAVSVAGWVLVRYNALVRLRNRLDNAWTQLDLQLRRRHEVVAHLLTDLAPGRRRELAAALERARHGADAGPAGRASAEADLVAAVSRISRVPRLGLPTSDRLEAVDAQISHACAHHNETVRRYNACRGPGPSALVARILGAGPRRTFTDPEHRPVVMGEARIIGERRSA